MKKILIIGATSAIAEATDHIWAQRGDELFLVARNQERLNVLTQDLSVRGSLGVSSYCMDANNFEEHLPMLDKAFGMLDKIDIVLIAHGTLSNQKECEQSVELTMQEIKTNALSAIALLTHLANRFEKQGAGTIAVISSVAGDRGRKSNYVYGAAKGLVTRYAQGLQHRFAGTGVKVVIIKPGPTDTPMTAHLKGKGAKLASVESVAKQIVEGVESGKPVIYAPGKWWLIMMVIRHLPALVFNKMNI